MNRTGFALIGAGVIGEVHARNIAGHPDARLRWVVDVDHARGGGLAAAYGAKFSPSHDEMLADPEVQVVVIGSSTDVHEAHLLASVRAGKRTPSVRLCGRSAHDASASTATKPV